MQQKFTVGYYVKPFSNISIHVGFERVIKNISGENFKQLILEARKLYDSGDIEAYTLFKSKLPAVTFSGIFSPVRNAASLTRYSYLIILDIDKIGDRLLLLKEQIFQDSFVKAIWISPSGDGLKFVIETSCEASLHKIIYKNALHYFSNKYGVELDRSGSDVSRLCFISYDPQLLSRTDNLVFDNAENSNIIDQPPKTSVVKIKAISATEIVKSKNVNSEAQKKTLKRVLHFLRKRGRSITGNYEDWVRVAFAISNTFSQDFGVRCFLELCRLDGSEHNEKESEKLIERCYQKGTSSSTFKTIIYLAQSQGYILGYNKSRQSN